MALHEYERLLTPARERFALSPGVRAIQASRDEAFLESFLLHFCALGWRMTAPVERWICAAAEGCVAGGFLELARELRGHARAEAGHDRMMIADARGLAARWNGRRQPSIDADLLLSEAPTRGVMRYCEVHARNLAGATPYAQLAIEYEIEMLPLRYGNLFLSHCVEVLGPGILPCIRFVTEHIVLDAGHTDFNARAIAKLLEYRPACLPALVSAGTAILDAYAQFLADCAALAERDARASRPLACGHRQALSWRAFPPPAEAGYPEGCSLPAWLDEVRALRAAVFFEGGRRPYFRTDEGFSDPDPVDRYAHHILAYDGPRVVGCVRMYRLTATGPACITEGLLGQASFSALLNQEGVQRSNTVEIGRWVAHGDYRATGRLGTQLIAAAAARATTLGNRSIGCRGMVVCAVGTGDKQDQMLTHVGLTAVPLARPIRCNDFEDEVRVMYCTGIDQLTPRFRNIVDEMAKAIGARSG